MPANLEPQTKPYLQGDLTPRRSDFVDLRNDSAGDQMQQTQSIILRYLEMLPAQDAVDLESMVADITRHYPFQGEDQEFFEGAVASLEKEGWIKIQDGKIQRDKVAAVGRKYLASLILTAMEHATPEAMKKYLEEHPKADKSKHKVKQHSDYGKLLRDRPKAKHVQDILEEWDPENELTDMNLAFFVHHEPGVDKNVRREGEKALQELRNGKIPQAKRRLETLLQKMKDHPSKGRAPV